MHAEETPEYRATLHSVEAAIHATKDEATKKRLQVIWLSLWHFDRTDLTEEERSFVQALQPTGQCRICGGRGEVDARSQEDPLGSAPCPECALPTAFKGLQ